MPRLVYRAVRLLPDFTLRVYLKSTPPCGHPCVVLSVPIKKNPVRTTPTCSPPSPPILIDINAKVGDSIFVENRSPVMPNANIFFFLEWADREDLYLQSVQETEEEINNLIQTSLEVLNKNIPGPIKYIINFDQYLYIQNGQAQSDLDNFFKVEPFPYLKVRTPQILSSTT